MGGAFANHTIGSFVDRPRRYGVSRGLDHHLLSVDPTVRCQGLGAHLISAMMDMARSNEFPLSFATSVRVYSANALAKLGWETVSTTKYADYKDESGNCRIRPPEPHTHIVVMAKSYVN